MIIGKYSTYNIFREFNDNRVIVLAYLKGQSIEGYDNGDNKQIMGMSVAVFAILFIFSLILYIWAIVALVKNFKDLPEWAKITGILLLFFGAPVITLIIVYVSRGKSEVKGKAARKSS